MTQTVGNSSGSATIGGVRVEHPRDEAAAEKVLTGPPLTKGYKPSVPAAMFQTTRGQAYLPSMLADVELMLLHPCVVAPYLYYKSAIASVKFRIKASSSAVGEFALAELQKFWTRCLGAVQDSYDYGWIGGELSYEYQKGLLGLYNLETFHPLDCWALTVEDNYVGVSVQNIVGSGGKQSLWGPGEYPAKGFWFAHNRRWDRYYGRSQLYGAWRPWRRLGYRDGAEEVIDGGVYRFAYRGPIMYYPARAFARADGTGVDHDAAQSKAREFVENAKAGASVALPNLRDENGNREWEIDWPDHAINVSSLVEYAKYLEAQVSLGIGVPMELLQASDTGSGWSGRKVPMIGFYQTHKRNAQAKVTAWKGQVGNPLVAWNFGPEAWFEVGVELALPGGLSEEGQQPGGAPPGGMPPGAPPAGGDSGNPLESLMGGGGEMSLLSGDDDEDEAVNSLPVHAAQGYRSSTRKPRGKGAGYEISIELAGEEEQARPFRMARGTVGATYMGKKYYGKEAEELLGRQKKQAPAKEQPVQSRTDRGRTEPLAGTTEDKAREGTLKSQRGKPGEGAGTATPQAQREKQKKTFVAKSLQRMRIFLGKSRKFLAPAIGKGQKVAREFFQEQARKSHDRFKRAYRTASKDPGMTDFIESTTELAAAAWDFLPAVMARRLRAETAEKNKVAKVGRANVKSIAEKGRKLTGQEEQDLRNGKADTIVEWLEIGIRAIEKGISSTVGALDPTGMVAPALGLVAVGPVLTGIYVATSAAMNPWGTAQAVWNTIRHGTKGDKERALNRKQKYSDAKRYAELPDDDPEVEENERKGRIPQSELGFTLNVDGEEEGKLYPGLRHRIREVFTTAKDPEWAEALFYGCMDEHRDNPEKAVALVEKLLKKTPKQPVGAPKIEPEKWYADGALEKAMAGIDENDGEADDEVDADEDSARADSQGGELGLLVADAVMVLTRRDLSTEEDLRSVQKRLRDLSPASRREVSRRIKLLVKE